MKLVGCASISFFIRVKIKAQTWVQSPAIPALQSQYKWFTFPVDLLTQAYKE